jgi:hypothetical protein
MSTSKHTLYQFRLARNKPAPPPPNTADSKEEPEQAGTSMQKRANGAPSFEEPKPENAVWHFERTTALSHEEVEQIGELNNQDDQA